MEQNQYITVDQLSTITRFSKSYIYKLTHRKQIPYYKPTGGKLYFKHSEIQDWLASSRHITAEEAQIKVNSKSRK